MAKLNIKDSIEIPEGITINIESPLIKVTGPQGTLERRINHPMIKIDQSENKINFELKKGTKREKTNETTSR